MTQNDAPQDSLTVRLASTGDIETLMELGRTTFREAFAADNDLDQMAAYMREAFDADRIREQLVQLGTRFFIAEQNSDAVGYAKLRTSAAPDVVGGHAPVELERIYVRSSAIGKGVGAELMQVCLDAVRSAGGTTIWLGVWEHNERAIRFYEKWDFQVVGDHTFRLGNESQRDVLMARAV